MRLWAILPTSNWPAQMASPKKPGKRGAGLSDKKNRHDRFHQKARKAGYRARAVFKLEELNDKHHLLGRADRVLDLGCAPGSWLQLAGEKIGPHGHLVGVDRVPVEVDHPNFRMIVGDIFEIETSELLGDHGAFDVVLSDMAPDTTGIRHVDQARSENLFEFALQIAVATLAPGGHFTAKLFMGPDFQKLIMRTREHFSKAKTVKPLSSRKESIEQYVVGIGFLGQA